MAGLGGHTVHTFHEASPPALRSEAPSELVRELGRWQATAVVVSTIIGTGVFLVAGPIARAAGSFDLFLITWIVGSVIALCGTLCFAELGGAMPAAGGLYCYLTRGLGPVWGFMFGWMCAVLGTPAGLATVAAGFARFASYIFPRLDQPWTTLHVGHFAFTLSTAQPLAALVVLAVTALNCLSVRFGGAVQVLLGSLKVGAAAVIVIAAAFATGHAPEAPSSVTVIHDTSALGAILTAMVPVMWAYNGFQNLGYLGAEIRDPAKNIPRALFYGMLIVGAVYILLDVMYCRVLPFPQVASSGHVASDVVQSLFGRSGAAWLTVVMGISALATLHAVTMAESRITYALARTGLFFGFAARVNARHRSPTGALLFVGTIGAAIALTGTFEQLFSLYIFAYWIFFALGAVALLRLRATEPDLPRPYRVWGYPWTALLFLAAALAITVNLWLDEPGRSSAGLLVILAGLPFYHSWRRSRRSDPAPRAVSQSVPRR
jgi:basic amino acid/polyamine antiporter, APA family